MIAVTIGDPAGIGCEIVLKALAEFDSADFAVYADARVVEKTMRLPGVPQFPIRRIRACDVGESGCCNVVDIPNLPDFEFSRIDERCGRSAYEYFARAVDDALKGLVSCVCTAPVHKVALRAAGLDAAGHTEMLSQLTGAEDPLTMFQVDGLRIFFLSRHVSLAMACRMVTRERLLDYIPRCIAAMDQLGLEGELAVAGLNPHCGDNGLFGSEERVIEEAVSACRSRGLPVCGPVSADSVFWQCLKGRYAAVLSLYHDQGHIAAKTYDFDRTISLTLGCPVLRLSVDHGTAFDIAGRGIADETGMAEVFAKALSWTRRRS